MDLRRKIDSFLLQWKKNPEHLPLIIKGARQVGKTYSIEKFAQSYNNFVEIGLRTLELSTCVIVLSSQPCP